jgi:dTMP kinase
MHLNTSPFKKINFEGIDGSGKSQQFDLAKKALRHQKIIFTKEPYLGHPSGLEIYDILHGRHARLRLEDNLTPEHFQEFYFYNRIQHYREVVFPALAQGNHVLSDRGPASMCYGVRSSESFEPLMAIQKQMFQDEKAVFLWPDAILIYDVPVEVAMRRLTESGKKLDQHETEQVLTRARNNYLAFANLYPNCHVIDGSGTPEEVFAETKRYLDRLLST